MQVSQPNNVKVYNLSSGKALPEWISDRKKRQLLKQDVELRRRIELIQDFDMPTASTCIRATPDGQYLLSTGVYKPRLKCFDVNQLSMKFDRCFDSEIVKFEVLSEDFSKLVFLQADRYIELHAQYGKYYRTRMPKFGRDLAYHKENCDLYLVGDGAEVFRLNLEQGRFLQPFETEACDINVCEINPHHQLLATGTSTGKVVCFDPRSKQSVGMLDIALGLPQDSLPSDSYPAVTALAFKNGLEMGVGSSTGHVLLYDIRANKPRLVKDQLYGLPINKVEFHKHSNMVVSTDSKVIKIWENDTGKSFTSIEPGIQINDFEIYPNSGLIFLANEAEKNSVYYVPSLGPAPKWCAFLDSITEELEESDEVVVYDDYKFVTKQDLENLGLSHLRGTNLMRAYMHGYFIDIRLYHKAKSIVEPFAYEEYRKNKIKQKLEEERASRIRLKKMPKVNRSLAEKLLDDKTKKKDDVTDEGLSNPLGDDRFGALFQNPDFQVDEESEEYRLLHPVVSKQDKLRQKRLAAEDSEASTDDEQAEYVKEDTTKKKKKGVKLYEVNSDAPSGRPVVKKTKPKTESFGDLLAKSTDTDIVREGGGAFGSKEITWRLEKSKKEKSRDQKMEEHLKERRKVRRSAGGISSQKGKKAVFWRGKKVK